jgi:hypothetical protein
LTTKYDPWLTRTAGFGNEVEGLLLYDIPDLSGRISGDRPWAFSIDDLAANEQGIQDALSQTGNSN